MTITATATNTSTDAGHVPSELRALNSAFAVVALDRSGRIVRANNRFLRLYGYELAEIRSRHLLVLLDDGDTETAARLSGAWEALARGGVQAFECRNVRKDGSDLWVRVVATAILDEEGGLAEVVAILSDLTAERMRASEERGQIAAIDASQAVVHLGLDGRIEHANARFLAVTGHALEELVGQDHRLIVDAEEAGSEAYRDLWADLVRGHHRTGEVRMRHRDGHDLWIQATFSPIPDIAGRPCKVIAYASDVTAERLRQADYQWQIAAIHTSHCVITFDMHGTILEANDLFLEATGYGRDEIVGRHHRIFVEPAYAHSSDYEAFWRRLNKGEYQSGQYRRVGKGGCEIWLQATYNPIFDVRGRPIKVVKYATVVTHEKLRQADHQGQIAAIHKAQCVIAFELDGTIVDANDNFLDLMGYRHADVRGRHHRLFVDPAEAEGADYAAFWKRLGRGQFEAGEYRRIGRDGREIWLRATYNPILDMNGRPFRVVKYATDITREKLRQADFEGQIQAINRSQGVVTLGMDGTILDVNEGFLSVLGYDLADIRGQHHSRLVEPDHARSAEYAEFWETLRTGAFMAGMYKRIGRDGREFWIRATYTPILDLAGKPYKIVKFATDVTSDVAIAEAFDDAKRQAQHDSATALPNRVRLASFMTSALAQPGGRLAVLYLDLDRFKPINDTFGHHVGDRVLGEVADRLRRSLKPDQLVARVGGDEFVVAVPGMPDSDLEEFCTTLQAAVSVPIHHEGGTLSVGMSIGVSVSPHDATTPDELLRCADTALYRSKQNGRGTFSFFAADMNDRIVAHRQMVDDMRRGLAAGEFFLEYQPRFGVRGGEIRSVEALVRWSHPERGRISPADFIPLAERSGLIVPLGEWIMRTACTEAASWDGIGVSVNVSPIQFRDGKLVDMVAAVLAESGLDGAKLEIEITEGVLIEDAERARRTLDRLKKLGVRLAIDDFGTGYASLSYLRNFPFDIIKIDRQFISDIDSREGGQAVVQAILALGRALGLSVTAEGVETVGQLAVLTRDQCAEAQGYLLARPMIAERLVALLADGREAGERVAPEKEPPALAAVG